jgi:hypothetical protein
MFTAPPIVVITNMNQLFASTCNIYHFYMKHTFNLINKELEQEAIRLKKPLP